LRLILTFDLDLHWTLLTLTQIMQNQKRCYTLSAIVYKIWVVLIINTCLVY